MASHRVCVQVSMRVGTNIPLFPHLGTISRLHGITSRLRPGINARWHKYSIVSTSWNNFPSSWHHIAFASRYQCALAQIFHCFHILEQFPVFMASHRVCVQVSMRVGTNIPLF